MNKYLKQGLEDICLEHLTCVGEFTADDVLERFIVKYGTACAPTKSKIFAKLRQVAALYDMKLEKRTVIIPEPLYDAQRSVRMLRGVKA